MAITAAPDEIPGIALRRALLLEEHPELALHVDPEHREQALAGLSAPCLAIRPGDWDPTIIRTTGRQAFGAFVSSGLLCRTLHTGGHPALELYGPGDVIGVSSLEGSVLAAEETWTVSAPARLVMFDDAFLHAARRWPRLVTGLFDLMQQQHDRLALQMVIAAQPRVEDRLTALFGLLSERYGRVSGAGVIVEVALTHEAIGRLIGAQRPTVSLALKSLSGRDVLQRRPGGRWLLLAQPGDASPAGATAPPPPAESAARFASPSALRTGTPSGT